jgi:hypothetical protein
MGGPAPSATQTLSEPGLGEAAQALASEGYAFVRAPTLRHVLAGAGLRDWDGFAASWNALGQDQYMADGGRYRRRRFAAFTASAGAVTRKPHQPHYQSRDYNQLNGGIARWFEPITDEIANHPATQSIIRVCDDLFTRLTPAEHRPRSWHVELHQFRITASAEAEGRPTPEGMHQDGVDWVLVLLIGRQNVASGVTCIADAAHMPLGDFTLAEPMDAALLDDRRVRHGVTAIHPLDPARPAWRDVLVLTFRYE